jgi:hypothetical protein
MVDDVHVRTKSEAFRPSNNTKRFGIKGVRATDCFLKYAREDDFGVCRTSNLIRNRTVGDRILEGAYRPTSKAGEAIGENSVTIWKMPSNLRSGSGVVTSTEIRATTLNIVSVYS